MWESILVHVTQNFIHIYKVFDHTINSPSPLSTSPNTSPSHLPPFMSSSLLHRASERNEHCPQVCGHTWAGWPTSDQTSEISDASPEAVICRQALQVGVGLTSLSSIHAVMLASLILRSVLVLLWVNELMLRQQPCLRKKTVLPSTLPWPVDLTAFQPPLQQCPLSLVARVDIDVPVRAGNTQQSLSGWY